MSDPTVALMLWELLVPGVKVPGTRDGLNGNYGIGFSSGGASVKADRAENTTDGLLMHGVCLNYWDMEMPEDTDWTEYIVALTQECYAKRKSNIHPDAGWFYIA